MNCKNSYYQTIKKNIKKCLISRPILKTQDRDYIVSKSRPLAQVRNQNRLKSVTKFSPLLRI